MEKSIESIWKKGFIEEDALIAPKLNAFYEKKSINFVDKFIRDFKINLWAIVGASIIPTIFGIVGKAYIPGITITLLLLYVAYYGKLKLDKLSKLEKTASSYHYIKQFNNWLTETINGYTNVYRFVYPLIFICTLLILWQGFLSEQIIDNFKADELLFTIPIYWGIGSLVIALFISMGAKKLYQLDMNIVYGAQFTRLKDMIEEMEALRKDS